MGNTAKKRRTTSRKKTRKTAVSKVDKSHPRRWGHEALAVVFYALGFFLLLSIISHKTILSQGSFTYDNVGPASLNNLMGPVGHVVATILTGFMGWCAVVPVVWAAWLGHYFWNFSKQHKDFELSSKIFVFGGLIGLVVFACALGALAWGKTGGGSIGLVVISPVSRLFSTGGSTLIISALLLLSIALASQQSLGRILRIGLIFILKLVCFSLITLPVWIFQLTSYLLISIYSCFSWLFSAFSASSLRSLFSSCTICRKNDEEDIPLPKPRKRKNRVFAEKDEAKGKKQKKREVVVERKVLKDKTAIKKINKRREYAKKQKQAFEQANEDRFASYKPPELKLLKRGIISGGGEDDAELRKKSAQIESKLRDFNIDGRVTHVHPGPVITLFEFEPAAGVKVGKIAALQDDLAMSLRALSVRIIAPIPKRGTVGIEVPNKQRDVVRLRDVMESRQYIEDDSLLCVPIGKDTYGNPVVSNIAAMPHLLMAGATGSGKSVCINAMLISLLYSASPAELGLILIDPKILELSIYEGIPHLKVPVVTEHRKARAVLQWAANEMERRYLLLQKYGVRSIDGYNKIVSGESSEEADQEKLENVVDLKEKDIIEEGSSNAGKPASEEPSDQLEFTEFLEPLPKIVIVIDELADLMLTVGRDIEELITRLAQKARAAGIHLIIATQRPSVDVITGLIKANFPARLSFRVTSRIDSRTILDSMGAEKLLGRGDMLFMNPGDVHLKRIHAAYVSDSEVKKIVGAIKSSCPPQYDEKILEMCDKALEDEDETSYSGDDAEDEYDAFYDQAVNLVVEKGQASTSMIQRAFRIGYNRAARIIDTMEQEGIVGPMDGSRPRDILAPGGDKML